VRTWLTTTMIPAWSVAAIMSSASRNVRPMGFSMKTPRTPLVVIADMTWACALVGTQTLTISRSSVESMCW
jgi:hypothetical protein